MYEYILLFVVWVTDFMFAFFFTAIIKGYSFIFHVSWVPFHHGMARHHAADGGDYLHIWRVAANTLDKESRTVDKRWSSSLGVGRGIGG
jgi:hypothetical protein